MSASITSVVGVTNYADDCLRVIVKRGEPEPEDKRKAPRGRVLETCARDAVIEIATFLGVPVPEGKFLKWELCEAIKKHLVDNKLVTHTEAHFKFYKLTGQLNEDGTLYIEEWTKKEDGTEKKSKPYPVMRMASTRLAKYLIFFGKSPRGLGIGKMIEELLTHMREAGLLEEIKEQTLTGAFTLFKHGKRYFLTTFEQPKKRGTVLVYNKTIPVSNLSRDQIVCHLNQLSVYVPDQLDTPSTLSLFIGTMTSQGKVFDLVHGTQVYRPGRSSIFRPRKIGALQPEATEPTDPGIPSGGWGDEEGEDGKADA